MPFAITPSAEAAPLAPSDTYAVIIGVDDYRRFDESVGQAEGTSDLQGARADALLWYRFLRLRLNVPAENIRLLVSSDEDDEETGARSRRRKRRRRRSDTYVEEPTVADVKRMMRRLSGMVNRLAERPDEIDDLEEFIARSDNAEGTERFAPTRQNIGLAHRWLRQKLAAAPQAAGIVTFSGHGLAASPAEKVQGQNLALCGIDCRVVEGAVQDDHGRTHARALHGHVYPRVLNLLLSGVAERVTLIVDSCYIRAHGDGRSLGLGAVGAPVWVNDTHGFDQDSRGKEGRPFQLRFLLASKNWEPAYELPIQGRWHGAFSWALVTLMEQWRVRREDGVNRLEVSYRDLMFRARTLVQTLGAPQTPCVSGERWVDNLPVFGSREIVDFDSRNGLSHVPNAYRIAEQLGGDGSGLTTFEFQRASDGAFLAGVVVSMQASGAYAANTEYWYTSASLMTDLVGTTDVQIVQTYRGAWAGLGSQISDMTSAAGTTIAAMTTRQNPTAGEWTRFTSSEPARARVVFKGRDLGRASDDAVGVAFELDSAGRLSGVTWVQHTQINDLFANVGVGTPCSLERCAVGSSNDQLVAASLAGHCASDAFWYTSS